MNQPLWCEMLDLFSTEKRRKPFSLNIKKIEWLKAAGESGKKPLLQYIMSGKIPKLPASKCRVCKRRLTWGDGSYNFDRRDNNPANNQQSNCYLVCKVCHGKHTKTNVIKERGLLGEVVGHRTIKLKVGYKKSTVQKPARRKPHRRFSGIFGF